MKQSYAIINLPQIEEVVTVRKKHPVLKEEERIVNISKQLHKDNEISEAMFKRLKPVGSQHARFTAWQRFIKHQFQYAQYFQ